MLTRRTRDPGLVGYSSKARFESRREQASREEEQSCRGGGTAPAERSIEMFGQILVPLDGSFRAEQALPVAARIARATGGSLLLVQVVTPSVDDSGGLAPVPIMTGEIVEEDMNRAADYL